MSSKTRQGGTEIDKTTNKNALADFHFFFISLFAFGMGPPKFTFGGGFN
jgi:hypothetical protein